MNTEKQSYGHQPACVVMETAAAIFGWPNYYLPFLVRAGHLKPLGKPAQNACRRDAPPWATEIDNGVIGRLAVKIPSLLKLHLFR
jgi:hypothetical protein